MATGGEYVKAPEAVQSEVPVEDQLNQLKIAAKGKINEFVDKANVQYEQAANDPSNKASDEKLKQDVDATAQDAANSYTKALNQLGDAFHMVESTGKQAAQQLGVATNQTATSAQELKGAAREQALQKSEETKQQVQSGQSALQQGIAKVHDALAEGAAVTNQKLQEGSHPSNTVTSEPRGFVHSGDAHAPTLFESLGNVITHTAQSVKDAFVTPSPTANQNHATPTSTNMPVTHPPAQSVSESLGQTAAALRDAIKSTWSAPREYPPATTAKPVQTKDDATE
ncbi:hypothetical protein KC19_5G021300 [Ceratodon purpureus]|uniref:Uncharacterized protein n=1 Tax=Ceratodon purpureus TaxID=3225 RepID=A0A8T0HX14_CERPU|nr:hypothetical protein KC19_5G021300 [Ceratodon purpureus]